MDMQFFNKTLCYLSAKFYLNPATTSQVQQLALTSAAYAWALAEDNEFAELSGNKYSQADLVFLVTFYNGVMTRLLLDSDEKRKNFDTEYDRLVVNILRLVLESDMDFAADFFLNRVSFYEMYILERSEDRTIIDEIYQAYIFIVDHDKLGKYIEFSESTPILAKGVMEEYNLSVKVTGLFVLFQNTFKNIYKSVAVTVK